MPLVSKIIEKSIHLQIEDYLNKKKVIYMYQSGFRTNHSIDICLSGSVHTGIILVDLQKAFDTLDQEVPLEKMKYFGFRAPVIKWFESYLSNRKFLVYINVFF